MPERRIPCPFCGSTELGSNSTFGTVLCEQCTRALKIAEWQSRPIEDALRAEVAALKAELAKYTEPLSEEQADCAVRFMGDNFAMLQLAHFSAFHWDAAIRRVRKGE